MLGKTNFFMPVKKTVTKSPIIVLTPTKAKPVPKPVPNPVPKPVPNPVPPVPIVSNANPQIHVLFRRFLFKRCRKF